MCSTLLLIILNIIVCQKGSKGTSFLMSTLALPLYCSFVLVKDLPSFFITPVIVKSSLNRKVIFLKI